MEKFTNNKITPITTPYYFYLVINGRIYRSIYYNNENDMLDKYLDSLEDETYCFFEDKYKFYLENEDNFYLDFQEFREKMMKNNDFEKREKIDKNSQTL